MHLIKRSDRVAAIAFMAATVALIAVNGNCSAAENNPQEVAVVKVSQEERAQNAAKYAFMVQAKDDAEDEFTNIISEETETLLATCNEEDKEALQELYNRVAAKAALNEEKKQREQLDVLDEDVQALVEAISELQTATEELSVAKNESNKVASSYSANSEDSGSSEALVIGDRVDLNYNGSAISITGTNRQNLEALVMSEAGGEGFIGAALVAQAIHDTMVTDNIYDVAKIKRSYGYDGSLDKTPNQDVKDAVAYIFDEGGMAVQHRIMYFYAPKICTSSWHETQKYVIYYNNHKFFDRW